MRLRPQPSRDSECERWGPKGADGGRPCGRRRAPSTTLGPALARSGGGRAAGPSSASESRSKPGARSLRRGRVPSPASSGALSQRGRRAAPRRPRRGLRGRADSPRPRQGLRVCKSGRPPTSRRPGFIQAGSSRRRSQDARPARGAAAAATARSAHRPRSGAESPGLRNPHNFQPPSLTQKFSTKCAMTIVQPPRRVLRPRPPAAV